MRILALRPRLASLSTRISNKFTLPERFKGTVVEKWAIYWKGLFSDYGEVLSNLAKDAVKNPKKSAIYGTIGYALYASGENNPDEEALVYALRHYNNNMVMVETTLQNPESAEYLRMMEQSINQGTLRLLSLGICTLLWLDIHDKDVCVYSAICNHTKVGYWNFHERIVDVGFWNHWWRLDWKMRNFDASYL